MIECQSDRTECEKNGNILCIEEHIQELTSVIRWQTFHQKFVPKADVWELGHSYQVFVYLPDVDKAEVKLEFCDDFLIVTGNRQITSALREGKVRLLESSFGTFQRRIKLQPGTRPECIKAHFEAGVLSIHIPKLQGQEVVNIKKVA